jgi:hypothetical protein
LVDLYYKYWWRKIWSCVAPRAIWTGNQAIRVWFLGGAGHYYCDWSWNPFYGHAHCTIALACTEVISSLWKWRRTGKLLDSLPRHNGMAELFMWSAVKTTYTWFVVNLRLDQFPDNEFWVFLSKLIHESYNSYHSIFKAVQINYSNSAGLDQHVFNGFFFFTKMWKYKPKKWINFVVWIILFLHVNC